MVRPRASITRGISPGGLRAPQQRFHARPQLARAEWLGDVIVRAHFEAHDAVGFLAPRGQHQDRQAIERLIAADFLADFEARKLRQHQVEQQNVRRRFAHLRQARGAVGRRGDLESFALEVVADQLDDIAVVFDQQNSFHFVSFILIFARRLRNSQTSSSYMDRPEPMLRMG